MTPRDVAVLICFVGGVALIATLALLVLKHIQAFASGLLALILLPLTLMNIFGGIVSGVWLAWLGEWKIIGYGLLILCFGIWPITVALMPALLLMWPTAKLAERNKMMAASICAIPSAIYTVVIMAAWCYVVFATAFFVAAERNSVPILLWSYGVATGPWSYMASKEDHNQGIGASSIYAFCVSAGYLIMIGMALLANSSLHDCSVALGVVMVCALVLQFGTAIAQMRSERLRNS